VSARQSTQSVLASEKGRHALSVAAMLTAAFFWALVEHLGKIVPRGYSPVQIVWSRYLFHLLFMLALFAPRRRTHLVRTGRLGLQISRALLMVGMPACFISGVLVLPSNTVWLISWCSVPMLLVMSSVLLGERVAPGLWIAVLGGLFGVCAMYGLDLPPLSWRYLPPLGMGFCFALYAIMTRRMHTEKTIVKLFHTAFWVFLVLSPLIPFVWKVPSIKALVLFASIGLTGYFGLYFLDKSIELAPVSLVFPLIYTVPLWDSIQAFALTGRLPGTMGIVGALIISTTSAVIILAVWSGHLRTASAQ
jgi:drug/metabolite transporter (DMT)-like permease